MGGMPHGGSSRTIDIDETVNPPLRLKVQYPEMIRPHLHDSDGADQAYHNNDQYINILESDENALGALHAVSPDVIDGDDHDESVALRMELVEAYAALQDEVINYSSLTDDGQVVDCFIALASALRSPDWPASIRHQDIMHELIKVAHRARILVPKVSQSTASNPRQDQQPPYSQNAGSEVQRPSG